MKNRASVLLGLCMISLAAGCTAGGAEAITSQTQTVEPADSIATTQAPNDTPICPPADGEGTVSPAISIYSMVIIVDGVEQIVGEGDRLKALPGEEVQVSEVTICVEPFSGDGGEACVDFAPISEGGQQIASEHKGTHNARVSPGLTTLSGIDFSWTWDESWSALAVVVNHWPPDGTADMACGNRRCEHDDWLFVEFE